MTIEEKQDRKMMWPALPAIQLETINVDSLKTSIVHHLHYHIAKDRYTATPHDCFCALAFAVRDLLIQRWIKTQQNYYKKDVKRTYYLSMEYLIGRTLHSAIINLGIYDICNRALRELNLSISPLCNLEWDAALGNGGLGRLAACFIDSMATLDLPAQAYGLRYDYGIFYQKIEDGYQVESPDNWLRYGNPWEIGHPEYLYPIQFYGHVIKNVDENNVVHYNWVDTQEVIAIAYDTPVPGYMTNTVNTLRLWSAHSSRGFDLDHFQDGDYISSVEQKIRSENITRVLYPADNVYQGKKLRLKQEYFLVSATLQDIIRRYKKSHTDFGCFSSKVAIQLNDTHPALAIPELMRILVDEENIEWEKAWEITTATFAYTNHTIMSEALETWPVYMLEELLPRHMQIIYEINHYWLENVSKKHPNDMDIIKNVSLIHEEGERRIRMANLSIVGSHHINGVSTLHTEILKKSVFSDFYKIMPEHFTSKTNGITPRRWLKQINPKLSDLIIQKIGDKWCKNLYDLKRLLPFVDDESFRKEWSNIKMANKKALAEQIESTCSIKLNTNSIFDVQVKRIHEYKRQLLNVFHIITLYNQLKTNPNKHFVPRAMIFGGKAAPSYFMAKLIIKLINSIADVINNDPVVGDNLKIVFMPNYSVSLAEIIIPAADVSEQISLAGTEASGTGNMKFTLNGALTIGTLDGANIEIKEEVGEENIFIFGHTAEEIAGLKAGYDPLVYYHNQPELKNVIDSISDGTFSSGNTDLFMPIIDSLLKHGDHFCVLADYSLYVEAQDKLSRNYEDKESWTRKSIINVARSGKFSSDRTVKEYAKEIWGYKHI